MTKFIYYAFILCIIVNCAPINESLTESEILKCNEKMPPSFGYEVNVVPSTKEYGALHFVLEDKPINDKIFEILTKSYVHSSEAAPTLHTIGDHLDTQGKGDSRNSASDYYFSINIGWEKKDSLADAFIIGFSEGIVQGSLGLLPVTISDIIKMEIYVKRSTEFYSYQYKESVTYVYWVPAFIAQMAMNEGEIIIGIGSEKCIPKIENMIKKFIKDFSKDWCSELHSSD